MVYVWLYHFNSLRPRQNGRHFADDIFKCSFLNENVWISIEISLKFVPKGPINNILALVQIMAWCRPGDKPLSEPMMVSLLTHICVSRPNSRNSSAILWMRPDQRKYEPLRANVFIGNLKIYQMNCQVPSRYPSQRWRRFMSPYDVNKPQWVEMSEFGYRYAFRWICT